MEDKLDAVKIQSELIMIRMKEAPSQKHVPLQFAAWICMQEGTVADNIFASSQLLADRCGGLIQYKAKFLRLGGKICNMCWQTYHNPGNTGPDRCTRTNISWLPESSYIVPAASKDMVPSSADTRPRNLCFFEQSNQLY